MFQKHPEQTLEFNSESMKDVVMNLVAEQNMDIMQEMSNLKKDLKGALETIDANLEYMKKEAKRRDKEENEAFKNFTTIVDQLVIKTESAVAAFSNHTKTNKPQTSNLNLSFFFLSTNC